MHVTCKNCGHYYKGKFCSECGQKASVGKLTVGHVLHEFWHNFTHTDKGYLSFLKHLILKPGEVMQNYIDGKRAKYFNPYTFFLVTTTLLIFTTKKIFHYENSLYHVNNEFGYYTDSNINIILLGMMPLLALIFKWIFFDKKLNYAESFTVMVMTFGLVNFFLLICNVFYFPLIKYHNSSKGYIQLLAILIVTYAFIKFIKPRYWWGYLKCIFSSFLFYFLIGIIGKGGALWFWGMPLKQIINSYS